MKWLVVVAGLGLVAWGGYLHWTGWLIVQVERGWSSVISGAVILAAGVLTLVLAAVMARLEQLARALAAAAQAKPGGRGAAQQQPASPPARETPAAAPPSLAPSEPKPAARREFDAPSLKEPAAPAPRRPTVSLTPEAPEPEPLGRPQGWLQRAVQEQGATRASVGSVLPAPGAEPEAPAGPPRITRRYESQGVQYTLYDDGSIDAESNGSRYHFASITELREFLARSKK